MRRARRAFAREFTAQRVELVATVIAPLLPEWRLLRANVRTGLATLALMCFDRPWHRRHRREGFMRLTYEELEALWPRRVRWEQLDDLNRGGRLFELWEPTQGLRKHFGMARGLRLVPVVAELIANAFYVQSQEWRANAPPRPRGRPPTKGIVDDEDRPLVAWAGIALPASVDVDLDGLFGLLEDVRSGVVPDEWRGCSVEQFDHRYRALLAFVHEAARGHGTVHVQYREASTGRLFAPSTSLQGVPKLVRRAALPSMFEYDISAAHPTLACAIAPELRIRLPTLAEYASNSDAKTKVRKDIAAHVGATYGDVKTCINALVYDASLLNPKGEIVRILGQARARRFATHPFVHDLSEEIGALGEVIMSARAGGVPPPLCSMLGGELVNAAGRVFNPTKRPAWQKSGTPSEQTVQRRLVAHVMQGYEVLILREIVREYGSRIAVLEHDGFTARDAIGCDVLRDLVRERTGFQVEFQVENRN